MEVKLHMVLTSALDAPAVLPPVHIDRRLEVFTD
jgi:hypothetical protein